MGRWRYKGRWVKHDDNAGCLGGCLLGLLILCAFPVLIIPIAILGGLGLWLDK